MSGPTPSTNSFEQSLQLFDKHLRVRWGHAIGQFVIDRKSYLPPSEIDFLKRRQRRFEKWCNEEPNDAARKRLLVEITEEIQSAVESRRIILYAPALDRRIFDMLVKADIRRFGGYNRMADELERLDRQAEKSHQNDLDNHLESMNREMVDQIRFVDSHRQTELAHYKSWPEMLKSGVKPSATRERDDSFAVIDRRPVKPEDAGVVVDA